MGLELKDHLGVDVPVHVCETCCAIVPLQGEWDSTEGGGPSNLTTHRRHHRIIHELIEEKEYEIDILDGRLRLIPNRVWRLLNWRADRKGIY